jgi:hypothetical protein
VEKLEPWYTLGNVNDSATMGNRQFLKNLKIQVPHDSAIQLEVKAGS